MSQLVKTPAMADELSRYLQEQTEKGFEWVVYDTDTPINSKHDLHCFHDESEAYDFARESQQIFNWHEAVPINDMLADLIKVEHSIKKDTEKELNTKTEIAMNLSNLEDRQYEMKALGFSKESTAKMQEMMEKGIPEFKLYESAQTAKGVVDYRLHYKKSAQSDFYYFNKFDVTVDRNKLRTPETVYMVISPSEKEGKSLVRKFETPYEAIDYFKQLPNSELSIGKDVKSRTKLAQIENSKMIYTERSFRQTYSQPPLPQTFYIDSGKGFTKEQAGNLMLGNAVYRDDLLNFQGVGYQAWVTLNFNKERDRYGNYPMNQYNDPAYGFDLNETLEKFRVKEMEKPETAQKLEASIRNGNTPLITVENQNNETQKVRLEVAVRFRNLNFFREDGKPVMREQFLKEGQDLSHSRANAMGLGQNQNESRTARMAR